MDIERIQALVQLMVDNDLTEIDIRSGEEQIALKRGLAGVPVLAPTHLPAQVAPAPPGPAAAPAAEPADDLVAIPSPMVGTFYAAPSPDSPPYITIGKEIDADTVVCIIEAMKVMNEIKGEVRGSVAKVLVNNGQAVEYGQPLFMVKKS
jgi:acetyl-CoA carboxylase biotin carboxyl carrier protein